MKEFRLLEETKKGLALVGICTLFMIASVLPFFLATLPEISIPLAKEPDNDVSIDNKGSINSNTTLSIELTYITFESQEFKLFLTIEGQESSQSSTILFSGRFSIIQGLNRISVSDGALSHPMEIQASYVTKVQFSPLNNYYILIHFVGLDLAVNATEWGAIKFKGENWDKDWFLDSIEELLHDNWSDETWEGDLLLRLVLNKQPIPALLEAILPLTILAFLPLIYWITAIHFKRKPLEKDKIENSRKFRLEITKWLVGFSIIYILPWVTEITKKPTSIMMSLSIVTLILTTMFYLTSDYNEKNGIEWFNKAFALSAVFIVLYFCGLSWVPIWV